MEVEYRRDCNRNYLILHEKGEIDMEAYPVRMLLANTIPCLLPCRQQSIDGEAFFYYDITSKQSIGVCYEKQKFQGEDLELLFAGIVRAAEQMAAFLLKPDQLCLEPEYIYLDLAKRELYFCCFPGRNVQLQEQLQSLTEYLLPKIEHKDARAVTIGYGIYRKVMEPDFHLEQVLEELYAGRTEREEEKKGQKEVPVRENPDRGQEYEMGAEYNKKSGMQLSEDRKEENASVIQKGAIAAFGLCAAGLIGMSLARGLGYFPELSVEILLGGMFLTGATGILAGFAWRRKKKNAPVLPLKKDSFQAEWENPYETDDSEGKTMLIRKIGESQPEVEEERFASAVMESTIGITEDLLRPSGKKISVLKNIEPGDLAEIPLKDELVIIGKLPVASDVVLSVPAISRIHAKLRKKGGSWYLMDLNSRNGTFVNGELLEGEEERELKDQDEVKFGDVRYIFETYHMN